MDRSNQSALPHAPATSRIYSVRRGWLVGMSLLGSILGLGGAYGVYYFGAGHETHTLSQQLILISIGLFFAIYGGYAVLSTITSKVIITPETIESRDIFSSRIMRKDDIAGYRIMRTQYVSELLFEPKLPDKKKLKITLFFRFDDVFDDWMASLQNYDAAELVQSLEQVSNDPTLGHTPHERVEKAGRARKIASIINVLLLVLTSWVLIYPRPYDPLILLLMALPWAAILIVKRSSGLFTFDDPAGKSVRGDLSILLMLPGFVLFLRAMFDIHFLDWFQIIAPSVLIAIIITLAVISTDPGLKKSILALAAVVLLLAVYAAGVAAHTNRMLDRSAPDVYTVRITEKHYSSGKHTEYYFNVTPWGPRQEPNEITVHRSLYTKKNPGDSVCIQLYHGAFRIPWYLADAGGCN